MGESWRYRAGVLKESPRTCRQLAGTFRQCLPAPAFRRSSTISGEETPEAQPSTRTEEGKLWCVCFRSILTRLTSRGHVATLAADVVGYSRLLGRDETGMLAYESAPPRFGRSQDHGTRGPYRRHQEGRKAGARRLSRESARRRVNPCDFNRQCGPGTTVPVRSASENSRKRQASWIMPRGPSAHGLDPWGTRALPALARPCSRRCAPLSSGDPVRPA
jgi:hypothetical protein